MYHNGFYETVLREFTSEPPVILTQPLFEYILTYLVARDEYTILYYTRQYYLSLCIYGICIQNDHFEFHIVIIVFMTRITE